MTINDIESMAQKSMDYIIKAAKPQEISTIHIRDIKNREQPKEIKYLTGMSAYDICNQICRCMGGKVESQVEGALFPTFVLSNSKKELITIEFIQT